MPDKHQVGLPGPALGPAPRALAQVGVGRGGQVLWMPDKSVITVLKLQSKADARGWQCLLLLFPRPTIITHLPLTGVGARCAPTHVCVRN